MNTDRIAYFLAVVREGSFSAAAKNMYVSQTAISQQIASLEKEMGCALFHRLSTGAVLTDQGEQFLPYAERLMGIQLELQDAFADAHRVSARTSALSAKVSGLGSTTALSTRARNSMSSIIRDIRRYSSSEE